MHDRVPIDVAVIGGGPAGLMAAETISAHPGLAVTVYERMPTVGRKLLMAGRGGLNLTHGEPFETFVTRYGDRALHLRPALEALPPSDVRAWAESLGQPTFVGTSGRIFPTAMKTSPLLRAWLRRLTDRGVALRTRHAWTGWDNAGCLGFDTPDGPQSITVAATVLALGGASWPGLGSDGGWLSTLHTAAVDLAPFEPANCGFAVAWTPLFLSRFEGQPLKRVAVRFADGLTRGDLVVTALGLEGGALYAAGPALRAALRTQGSAHLEIDLRPDVDADTLGRALSAPRRKQSLSSFLRKAAKLSPVDVGLLQEAAHAAGTPLAGIGPTALASLIKSVPVRVDATASLDRAISTAGGIRFGAIDSRFMLTARPGTFAAGEMLDWEAPTGGYLLQACLATGAAAGRGVLAWLSERGTLV